MASVYRPRYEEDPNSPTNEKYRERSPRRSGRLPPGGEVSAGQGTRKADRNENRSRSPDRISPKLGPSRVASDLEKRNREYEREGQIRIRGAAERKREVDYSDREQKKREYENQERELRAQAAALKREADFREREKRKRDEDAERERRAKEAALYKKSLNFTTSGGRTEPGLEQISRPILRGRLFSFVR
jgi:hypothetical protein